MKAGSPRGARTKRRIMETAFDLFHIKGVAGTSPDEIIAASGTGKGQFYYYFANKTIWSIRSWKAISISSRPERRP